MKNKALQKLLGKRQMDVTLLAKQLMMGRSALTEVLLGIRKGTQTWKKLKTAVELGFLTEEEYKVAKDFAESEAKAREEKGQLPRSFPAVRKMVSAG